jgi:hypothetical protein
MGTGGSFPGGKAAGTWGKLTTHLHLVPRSRMRGATPPLPQYVFMAWCLVKHRDNFTFTSTLTFNLPHNDWFPRAWQKSVVQDDRHRIFGVLFHLLNNYSYIEKSGFRKGRSCSDCFFTLKQLFENRKEFRLSAYVRVNKEILILNILEEEGLPHLVATQRLN